jgi:F-type H+-transporting ATPase subunit gamma
MSETTVSLRRQLASADDLRSVVRTMKAMAASNLGQYEMAVSALGDYYRSVELGLSIFFRDSAPAVPGQDRLPDASTVGAVIFGSDQGLVGSFNDVVADYALESLAGRSGDPRIWAVGERVHARLTEAGHPASTLLSVPNSVRAITPLIGRLLIENALHAGDEPGSELFLFYNSPTGDAGYEPVQQRLLPLDDTWRRNLAATPWPTGALPEVLGGAADSAAGRRTLRALLREYLFVSLFRACAESLASENASRLAAMQRADRNIDELLETLSGTFHRLRQRSIDEELFDLVSGFEALSESGS